jgi:hypothetical protein
MIPKYTIEYRTEPHSTAPVRHHSTDDPVACETFIEELLENSLPIHRISHEGVELSRHEFDRIIKSAGMMLVSKRICSCLEIKPEEERFRFGFAA